MDHNACKCAIKRSVLCVDFQLRMHQNRLSVALYPDTLKKLTLLPKLKAGSWRGDPGQGRDTNERKEKGRREMKKLKRKDGRERGKVPCRHLFFPVLALLISELVASVYYCESCVFCVLFFYVNLSFG